MGWLLCLVGLIAAQPSEYELRLVRDPLAIGPGRSASFTFGTLPQQGSTVLLEVNARVHLDKAAGSMYFLKLSLNGREVHAARSRRVGRLVNKPLVSPVAVNVPSAWFAGGAWRVVYAPDFEVVRRSPVYVGDPYTLVLDVTDLTNPAAENRLEVVNALRPGVLRARTEEGPGPHAGDLVLGGLLVRTRAVPSPTMAAAAAAADVINTGQPAAGAAAYRGAIAAGGGLIVEQGRRTWRFSTAISFPNAGYNRLAADDANGPAAGNQSESSDKDAAAGGQSSWRPDVQPHSDGGTVRAVSPYYRLERIVRFGPRKTEISDRLINTSGRPLGLAVRHEVDLGGLGDLPVRLAGIPDPSIADYYSPTNPSVHLRDGGQGMGMLVEDDVFRNQARLFWSEQPPAAGFRTGMLYLGPGEEETLRWSIYPVAGPDYFDLVNLVRQDWKSNVAVDGAWTFFQPDTVLATPAAELAAKFQRLGIRYAVYCGGWVDPRRGKRIGFGTGVMDEYWADFRDRLKRAAEKLRAAVPGVKVLVYYDSQRDTSEGGDARFADSWLTDAGGRLLSTDWSGRYSLTWSMVATRGNSFGRAMLAVADRYLTEIGADGLYWDEMEQTGYGQPLLTYSQHDGRSCLLDPRTLDVARQVGITSLLGEAHRLEVVRRVREQGGVLMGNGPPFTRAMLQTGVPRMVEIQHNDYWCYEGNLGTPLGYLSSRPDFGNVLRCLRFACLPVGTRYDYEHEISASLFPFTPVELHAGYLLGRERIVATHAGRYGWAGERVLAEVRHFDAKGKRTDRDFDTQIGTEARTMVELGPDEAVVLVRLPVEVHAGRPVEVRRVRGAAGWLELQLRSTDAATIVIGDPMAAAMTGHARLGETEIPLTRQGGRLSAPLPSTAGQWLPLWIGRRQH